MPVYRTIIRDDYFEAQLAELTEDAKQADEVIQMAEWTLSRSPEKGEPVDTFSPVRGMPFRMMMGLLTVAVYYLYDDDHVWLVGLKVTDTTEETDA